MDTFTNRARKVLVHAQEEAFRRNHQWIGTEHLLVGLVREEGGRGAQVLRRLGVDLHKVRRETEQMIGHGDKPITQANLTPRTKRVIELAVGQAEGLQDPTVGTEHLLLGLLEEGQGIAAMVLRRFGVTADRVVDEISRLQNRAPDQ